MRDREDQPFKESYGMASKRAVAARTAADNPATPLPRTRTSKGPGRAPVLTPVRSG